MADETTTASAVEHVITVDELADYLNIEYIDEATTASLERIRSASEMFLSGALGELYPRNDARVKELALLYGSEMYENRLTTTTSYSSYLRNLVTSLQMQIKLEMSRGVFDDDV